TRLRPAGKRSLTWTLVAVLGPLSLSVIVKVTVSPTFGVGLSTLFSTARSACCGVSVALLLLLPALGSNWSARLIAAVFICALGLTTVALNVSVRADSVSTVPTVHTPLPLL